MKALFHVNENARWPRVLVNTTNFIKDVGQGQADIEIIANGAAVTGYADNNETELLGKMTQLAQAGVKFAACSNALKMHNIAPQALPDFVTVVSAGITEIVQKQAAGFAYIKP